MYILKALYTLGLLILDLEWLHVCLFTNMSYPASSVGTISDDNLSAFSHSL